MNNEKLYTTQLAAGLGVIDETRILLDLWQPGMKSSALYQTALDSGDFPNVTARRLRNIVAECFAPRYLVERDYPAALLKDLKDSLSSTELAQLFFLFTSRANTILADFVKKVYWMRYASGQDTITRLIDESRARSSQYIIYLLGKEDSEMDEKLAEIYRCREICNKYRNEPDQEVKEYCSAQTERSAKLANDLQHIIKRSLTKGSFLFRGKSTAVENLGQELLDACKKHLTGVAPQVFDRNSEAPVRVDTSLAEKFLKAGNLSAITSQIDPLGLVQNTGGTPSIQKDHIALISIRDTGRFHKNTRPTHGL